MFGSQACPPIVKCCGKRWAICNANMPLSDQPVKVQGSSGNCVWNNINPLLSLGSGNHGDRQGGGINHATLALP